MSNEQAWPPLMVATKVKTVRPEKESNDWDPEALKQRRWDIHGEVVRHSDSHGLCYLVRHVDGTKAWYEPRELVLL